MQLSDRIRRWLRLPPRVQTTDYRPTRGRVDHVIIIDGTLSTLAHRRETNAGRAYKLLQEVTPSASISLRYEKGTQWIRWRDVLDVIDGTGIDGQICRAYGFLASRYKPGDRIFLMGYSRGAYAVRSMAGMIDMIGLLQDRHATERNIRDLYRHYQMAPDSAAAHEFAAQYCHPEAPIEMVGVWDTVRALGFHWPVLWRFSRIAHDFHSAHLGDSIRHGFHALAMDETRKVYTPVMWESREGWSGVLEQMWFRGSHADIGGQLGGFEAARPLANIPLVWMLQKAEGCGVNLPEGWERRFVQDVNAPSVGSWRGWAIIFPRRARRLIGRDKSEQVHRSVPGFRQVS